MSFNINKQLNADEQEPIAADAEGSTATTNVPVEESIETMVAAPVEVAIETAHDDFAAQMEAVDWRSSA